MKEKQHDEHQALQKGQPSCLRRKPVSLLRLEQARSLLITAQGHRDEVLLMLALVLGLRAGELLALQWQAIDWEAGSLGVHLTRSPSRSGAAQPPLLPAKHSRTLPLPRMVRDCLQQHALCQQQEHERAGTVWQQVDLILSAPQGYPLPRAHLTPMIQNFLRQAHVPVLRFHEVRQTTAHLLLLAGLAPALVGAILGVGGRGFARFDHHGPFPVERYEEARQVMERLFFEP